MHGNLLHRRAEGIVRTALRHARVVLINGPRQSGKTTLAREILRTSPGRYASLDDAPTLQAAVDDPGGFVEGEGLLVIDEFQRAGDPLLLAIKSEVDRKPAPGRFLLAGSSRFLTVPTLSESLAGRVDIVDLLPLSQGEIRGIREDFIGRLFGSVRGLRAAAPAALSRRDCFEAVCRGGLPESVRAGAAPRRRFLDSYVRTVLARDAREILRANESRDLRRVLALLAASTAQEENLTAFAGDLGIPRSSLTRYLALFEMVYLLHEVPAWSRNLTSKVVRHPEVHLTDTGVAARLLRMDPDALLRPTSRAAGPLLETFVVNEISRQASWSEDPPSLHHFRDRDGREIDLVLEMPDGRVAAMEIKASRSPGPRGFRNLEWLRDRLGDSFVNGVVLYLGEDVLSFGDRMTLMPVSALWAE